MAKGSMDETNVVAKDAVSTSSKGAWNAGFGEQLKAVRCNMGWTLKKLSERADISLSMLSKVENNKAVPSLVALHRIVDALGVNIGMLFPKSEEEETIVFREGDRPRITAERGVSLERLVPFGPQHSMQGNIHIVEPGCGSEGWMQHEGEEVGFVLEGTLELSVDKSTYVLHPGDAFNFRSSRPHLYRNSGKTMCRVIWINTPPTF